MRPSVLIYQSTQDLAECCKHLQYTLVSFLAVRGRWQQQLWCTILTHFVQKREKMLEAAAAFHIQHWRALWSLVSAVYWAAQSILGRQIILYHWKQTACKRATNAARKVLSAACCCPYPNPWHYLLNIQTSVAMVQLWGSTAETLFITVQ